MISEFNHNTLYMKIVSIKENLDLYLSIKNFENNKGNEIIIPKRVKLKVQKYLDENNLEEQDFQKGSMVKCNIICNKLWFIDNNIFGIWWSVNSI